MDLGQARHAFITGGASGIGLGIAEALAERGLSVTIADIDREQLPDVLADRGDRWRGQVLDVRDRAAWASAKAEAEATFGPVDVVVNNAGIAPIGRELADEDPATFDLVMAVNLVGVFNGVSAFASDFRARKRGHIDNTASLAGLIVNSPGFASYGIAKFGVVGMSEVLRVELAPHGVGVSVLCPGYVQTNIARNSLKVAGDTGSQAIDLPPSELSAREVGAMVARAIEQDLPYVISHADGWPSVESRIQGLRKAFGK